MLKSIKRIEFEGTPSEMLQEINNSISHGIPDYVVGAIKLIDSCVGKYMNQGNIRLDFPDSITIDGWYEKDSECVLSIHNDTGSIEEDGKLALLAAVVANYWALNAGPEWDETDMNFDVSGSFGPTWEFSARD